MDLDFTDEQEMLREMVRGVCADYAPLDVVRELEDDPDRLPRGFWKQLAALDLIGLTLPAASRRLGDVACWRPPSSTRSWAARWPRRPTSPAR